MAAPAPAFRAALRIARRDALRARGRSALIAGMVALPVAVMTFAAVALWSLETEPAERLPWSMGAADAVVRSAYVGGPVVQLPDDLNVYTTEESAGPAPGREEGPGADPDSVLPPGSRVIEQRDLAVSVATAGGIAPTTLREVDYGDPLLAGLVLQEEGRAPAGRDEVAVSPALLERTGLRVGDRLELVEPARVSARIVGTARPYGDRRVEMVLTRPGALDVAGERRDRVLYADTPQPVSWAQVRTWNTQGVLALSRAVVLDPPPRSEVPFHRGAGYDDGGDLEFLAVLLVGGLAGLEVVLLAGAAFAVGARRQARQLALAAASGAEPRHVRAVVLIGGVVLGLAGALTGLLAGIAAAAIARPGLEALTGLDGGPFEVRPAGLLPIATVGLVVAVAAAALPARAAARADVLLALANRRGTVRTRRRVPAAGIGLLALGIIAAAVGAGMALAATTATDASDPSQDVGGLPVALIVGGALLAQIGLVVLTPAIVGGVGRLAGRLPLTLRLAARDSARHRSRTAPVVAAVLAGVAGATALTVYVSSSDARDRRDYSPQLAAGQAAVELAIWDVSVSGSVGTRYADPAAAQEAVRSALPVRRSTVLRSLDHSCEDQNGCLLPSIVRPEQNRCPLDVWYEQSAGDAPPEDLVRRTRTDPRCANSPASGEIVEGDAATLGGLGVQRPAEALAVLERGGAVLFDPRDVVSGRATFSVGAEPDGSTRGSVVVPAIAVPGAEPHHPVAVVSEEVTAKLGATSRPGRLLLVLDRPPTQAEEDRARKELSDVGLRPDSLYVERGYVSAYGPGLLTLVLASALLTLGAVAVGLGLAQADARPDHATLAAIGASPGTRRKLAMGQAAVVAGVGTGLGLLAGLVPALALIRADPTLPLALPLAPLAVLAVVVPVVAAGGAGLLVRSRLPMVRRFT